MNNIILHIGYSKAASTWLQNIFSNTDGLSYIHKPRLWKADNCGVRWDKHELKKVVDRDIHYNLVNTSCGVWRSFLYLKINNRYSINRYHGGVWYSLDLLLYGVLTQYIH